MSNGYVVQSGDQLPSLAGECNLLNVSAWYIPHGGRIIKLYAGGWIFQLLDYYEKK